MNTSKTLLGTVLFAILGGLFLYMAGYFTEKLPQQRVISQSDYPEMETVKLQAKAQPIQREFTGTIVADQKAILSARITARVAEVLVDVGNVVKQGDVIMRLDSDDLDARVKQTEQALSSAQARLNAARKEYKRVSELVNKKLLSQAEFDRVESELKTAQANFKQSQAAVSEAETTFGFSMITAPFDGLITQKNVNRGDTATPGMQLVSMYNPDTLQLQADISESQIKEITLGSSLQYQLPTYGIHGVGDVVEIAPAADNTSRTFIIKLSLNSDALIYPGSFGKVSVMIGEQELLTLPNNTLYQVGQLDYVKVVNQGLLQTRLVQLSDQNVVRKGVVAGDVLVVDPLKYGQ
ncbi:hemolysin D [Vibrio sp. MACH09]|uniref:efflux RND transporter periplasmic adaptor subunit n=1 Tax=Vibrio sp. MACH09 TaxID=3025122 RepID=UPI0027923C41|nr:efflux RND transporter periplasmic adaptor subunit [Vibrio sp. MACH09]GLO63565.1 hemolysin D [Vibrio sp. MACH09]